MAGLRYFYGHARILLARYAQPLIQVHGKTTVECVQSVCQLLADAIVRQTAAMGFTGFRGI